MPKNSSASWMYPDASEEQKRAAEINKKNDLYNESYKKETQLYKALKDKISHYKAKGIDVSKYEKKLDEMYPGMDFTDKVRTITHHTVDSYMNAIPGIARAYKHYVKGEKLKPIQKSYSQELNDAKLDREKAINPISTMAIDVGTDPLSYIPYGNTLKGGRLVRAFKDYAKGASIAGSAYTARHIGDDNYKPTDTLAAGAFGGLINAGVNGVINRKIKKDILNSSVTKDSDKIKKQPLETPKNEITDDNEIAKKILEAQGQKPKNILKDEVPLNINNKENLNDIELPIQKKINKLPEKLPLGNDEEIKDLMKYAVKHDAIDEFLSKLPKTANKEKTYQILKKAQIKEDKNKIIPVYINKKNKNIIYAGGDTLSDTSTPQKIVNINKSDIHGESILKNTPKSQDIKINASPTLAGGMAGGLESQATQRDYNNDGIHNYKDNLYGILAGIIGVHGVKKIFPKAFKDENIDKNAVGMFVGKKPSDTVRVENKGLYKIPLNKQTKDLSKIKANELIFKEFNNVNSKHKEQGITKSADLKRLIDKALGKPNVFAKGTSKDTRLISSNIRNKDNIIIANKNSGNIVSGFSTNKPNYIKKVIEKDKGSSPNLHSSQQGATVSSIVTHNTVPNPNNKDIIPNKNNKSQDIKINASPTLAGGMAGTIVGANNDIDQDGKITYKDLLYGALGGVAATKGYLSISKLDKFKRVVKALKENDNVNAVYAFKLNSATDFLKLRNEVFKSTNKRFEEFADLHEQLKLLNEDTRKAMYEYMNGNKNVKLPNEIKSLANYFTNEIDKSSKELVRLGVLQKEQYEKFKGRYLHRKYEKDFKEKFTSLLSKGKTIQGVYSRGKEWSGTKADYEQMLKNGEIGDFFNGKIEAHRMRNGQYKFRQDYSKEQRSKWGEIDDIAFSLPNTLMRNIEMVEHSRFLKHVLNKTKYVIDEPLEGYIQLVGKRYGALNNMYVRKDIAQDINEFNMALFGTDSSMGFTKDFINTLKAFVTYWKKTHTVYNVTAHVNNLMSNVALQYGSGINPRKAVINATKGYVASSKVGEYRYLMAKKIVGLTEEEKLKLQILSKDEDFQLWQKAKEHGLFGRSRLNDVLNQYINPSNSINKIQKGQLLNKIDQKLSRMYQGEDDIMRFSTLKSLLEKQGYKEGKNFNEIIDKVNTIIPDYTKPMSSLARGLRNTGIVPFISWTYYATPIILNQFKNHPIRVASMYGALYGINKLMGIDPFDEKDIPQQNFSMKRIPIYKNGNEITTIKVDRWIPHNDLLNPVDFIKNIFSTGIYSPLLEIPRNQNLYYGGKITYNKGSSKAYDLSKYAIQQLTPDMLDRLYNLAESKVLSKKRRTKNPVIKPRSTVQEILNNLGLNTLSYDKAKQEQKIRNEELK